LRTPRLTHRGLRHRRVSASRGWLINPRCECVDPSVRERACRPAGHGEHARFSAVAGGLLGRHDDVGRREEPPRYESGFRAHGSNQRFHRLLRHAVARALTTAPSLAGVSPAAPKILTPQGRRRKRRPGRCGRYDTSTSDLAAPAPASVVRLAVPQLGEPLIVRRDLAEHGDRPGDPRAAVHGRAPSRPPHCGGVRWRGPQDPRRLSSPTNTGEGSASIAPRLSQLVRAAAVVGHPHRIVEPASPPYRWTL
jgi:hypothetical protein